MLVRSRRVGEKLVIDGAIGVTVLAVKGDRVRLGVNAPGSVTVDRSEVHDRRGRSSPRSRPRFSTSLPKGNTMMTTAPTDERTGRAFAFDLDAASLASLREALPGWAVEPVCGATPGSLATTWDPGLADLLVVGLRDDVSSSLGLCRFLAFCNPYSIDARRAMVGNMTRAEELPDPESRRDAPLLVLVLPEQEVLVGAALEAGAGSCLMLPIHPKEVTSVLAHARAGNQPGRHTLNRDQAQHQDPWRDHGGQG